MTTFSGGLPIPPELAPSNIGIEQEGMLLRAVSGCCGSYLEYRDTGWACTTCRSELTPTRSSWGFTCVQYLDPFISEIDPDMIGLFNRWVSDWTGLEPGDFEMRVQIP